MSTAKHRTMIEVSTATRDRIKAFSLRSGLKMVAVTSLLLDHALPKLEAGKIKLKAKP